jgi:hypothetical protein
LKTKQRKLKNIKEDYSKMTWKEIKDEIEKQGVKDEDKVNYIDISYHIEDVTITKDSVNDGWEIWS